MFMRFVLSRFLLAGMVLVGVSSLAFAGEEASTDAPPAPASNPLTPFALKNPPTYAAPGFAGTSPSSYTPPDIPNDYDGAMQYGIASFQLGDFEKAKVAFTKVLYMYGHAQNPYAIGWLNAIKNAQAIQNQQEEGAQQYYNNTGQRPMVFQPHNAQWEPKQGAYAGQKYGTLVSEIEKLIEKADGMFQSHNAQLRQYDRVLATLERALRMYPNDPLLMRLKTRTEGKLSVVEGKQNDFRNAENQRRSTVTSGVNNLLGQFFGTASGVK